ncbi:MAG: DUF177 domain-containing protein [Magnetococcales bacterium]|nr:DUF177 domain-containing protein [Magnetococcales bacterium]
MAEPRWGELGESPRDLSAVTLELGSLVGRSTLWTAAGILVPVAMEELAQVGTVDGPIEVHVEARPIQRAGRVRVQVRGHCRGVMRLSCVRCLVEFPLPLAARIDAIFAVGPDPAMKNKNWRIEEDLEFLPDGLLKIRHLVEEELLLALPMNPICVSGCAGLCAGCGVDLNRNPCGCRATVSSGPFAVLKTLQST